LKYFLFLFLISNIIFSQNKLEIKVSEQNGSPLFRAIVIVEQNGSQTTFGTTNTNGTFNLELGTGNYDIKVNKLGFVAQKQSITLSSNTSLTFELATETNNLETVVIKSRPKIITVRKDTISYNLKTVVNGTERKVEDVIKKLPGMNVDENGKVFFKGQQINNVLIDGNEFFGNKHQMATQNIDAKMVEGIDLLTNYQGFSKSGGGAKGIALNLKLKDGYKQKFIGDIEASLGNNEASRVHINLFRFAKKGNLAIISDYNSISKTPITVDDYQEMRISNDDPNEQSSTQTFELPAFLEPSNYIRLKKNAFVGVNYTSVIGEKSKITFSNLFNNTNMIEESSKTQTNIGQTNVTNFFNSNKTSNYTLNNSDFKWEFNKSKNTFISYKLNFTPNQDGVSENINQFTNQFLSDIKNNNFVFSQVFKINSTIIPKLVYKFQINQSFENNSKETQVNSTTTLFGLGIKDVNQFLKFKNSNLSVFNQFTYKEKQNSFIAKFLLLQKNSSSKNSEITNRNENNLFWKQNVFQTQFLWQHQWNFKWQTTLGLKSTNNFVDLQQKQTVFTIFEPIFILNYNISQIQKIGFNIDFSHDFPSLFQLQNSLLVEGFQNVKNASLIDFKNHPFRCWINQLFKTQSTILIM
jgi:hypothetical protein